MHSVYYTFLYRKDNFMIDCGGKFHAEENR